MIFELIANIDLAQFALHLGGVAWCAMDYRLKRREHESNSGISTGITVD